MRRAHPKLAAIRQRARRLRHRVLTGAAIAFVVLWVAIFTQMITGHDPALGPATATTRTAAKEGTAREPEARVSDEDHGAGDDDEEGEDHDEEEGGRPAPVEEVAAPVEELEPATTGQS